MSASIEARRVARNGTITVITGSPTRPSRTQGLASVVTERLKSLGYQIHEINVRDLPAEALLHARFDDERIKDAVGKVEAAHGIVVATPVYKAAYSGILKSFLDLLPQFGLRGKVVLPLLTGGTIAHVLALDYALRPVLQSLDPRLVVSGLFVLDKWIELNEGGVKLEAEVGPKLEQVTNTFLAAFELPAPSAHA
jgi:FMN reductase